MWKKWRGDYEVSDAGEIRKGSRIIGQVLRKQGYYQVGLFFDGKYSTHRVHTIVAEVFLGPRPKGMVVCHGELGKTVNTVGNLSYGTQRKNSSEDLNRDHIFSSRFPGVSPTGKGKWRSRIQINGRQLCLGTFSTEELAAEAYKNKLGEINCTY